MAKREQDSLDNDFTQMDEEVAPTPDTEQSLGEEATFIEGDAESGGEAPFDDDMEIVDLSKRYQIEQVLGKGGMGEVLLATDTRLKRQVAIKRVLGEMARSKKALARFVTEAQAIARLDHDNIVDIYDYGRDQEGPFLIMQYVDGGSLLDRCQEGPIPLEEAVELTCQLCNALEMAHANDIIHRLWAGKARHCRPWPDRCRRRTGHDRLHAARTTARRHRNRCPQRFVESGRHALPDGHGQEPQDHQIQQRAAGIAGCFGEGPGG